MLRTSASDPKQPWRPHFAPGWLGRSIAKVNSGEVHMKQLLEIAGLTYVLVTASYLYAFTRFYRIVNAEHPDWLKVRGSLSSMYDGLPRLGDPNVSWAVIKTAYSLRVHELRDSNGAFYAGLIRVFLPAGVMLFAAILLAIFCFRS